MLFLATYAILIRMSSEFGAWVLKRREGRLPSLGSPIEAQNLQLWRKYCQYHDTLTFIFPQLYAHTRKKASTDKAYDKRKCHVTELVPSQQESLAPHTDTNTPAYLPARVSQAAAPSVVFLASAALVLPFRPRSRV